MIDFSTSEARFMREALERIVANKDNKNWRKPEVVREAECALEKVKNALESVSGTSAAHNSIDFCDWLYGYMGHSTAIKIDDYAATYIRQKLAVVVKANDEARRPASPSGDAGQVGWLGGEFDR